MEGGERGVRLIVAGVTVAVVLYAVLAVVTGYHQAGPGDVALPHGLAAWSRAGLGLATLLLFPGTFIALAMPASGPRDPVTLLLQSLGWSTVAYLVNLSLLKLAVGSGTLPGLLVVGSVEAAVAFSVGRRHHGRLRPISIHELIGLGLVAAMVAGLIWSHRGFLFRELEDYWYSAEAMGGGAEAAQEPGLEAAGVTLARGEGWEPVPAEGRDLYHKRTDAAADTLVLRAVTPTEVTLRYLWQGPVGSRLRVACEDAEKEAVVERAPIEQMEEGPTLRYLDRGIVMVSLPVMVRQERACTIEHAFPVASTSHAATAGILVDLTGWPLEPLPPLDEIEGWQLSHYYQILNISENVEWARRTLRDQWLTINQPPLWSYVYSAVVVYVGGGLWAVNLFFFVLVGLTALVVARLAGLEAGELPWPFWLIPILIGVSHARIIVASGSTNFPDNLYAFTLLSSLYLLYQGHTAGFAGAGVATSLLRYPGSTVTVIATGLGAWALPGRRRSMLRAALLFGAGILALCAALGMGALFTGQLESWLEILHFETLPEHFHGQYDPRELMRRPPEFYGLLLRYTGFTPVLLLAMKGRLAKWAASTGLVYSFFLCFIDHFPSHYFVPLMHLTAVAVTATVLARQGPMRWSGLALSCAGLAYSLLLPLP